MSAVARILEQLGGLRLERVVEDSPAGREFADKRTAGLLVDLPALSREATYLELLRMTGGLHAHDANGVSFGVFGYDDPGYGITSLDEGELLDGEYFRFGDLMLPEYEENVVFAFDLSGHDPRVFATPGSARAYEAYASSFEALIDRIVALANGRERGARK